MRSLVADDDPVCRQALADWVTSWGFQALLAGDGAEAMQILRGPDPPRLVILDWNMPRMDGFEVCRAVRRSPRGDDTYILLVTGARGREEIMKVIVAGADDYLAKPIEPIDLKIRLRTAVRILDMQAELRDRRRSSPSDCQPSSHTEGKGT